MSELLLNEKFEGAVDTISNVVEGWVRCRGDDISLLRVCIYIDDNLVGTVISNHFRQDLFDCGIGTGRYAFSFRIPETFIDNYVHTIHVKVEGDNFSLPGTPAMFRLANPNQETYDENLKSLHDFVLSTDLEKAINGSSEKKKLAICAVYQTQPYVEDFQKVLFQSIRQSGYYLVVVNPCMENSGEFIDACSDHCDFVICRHNIGYDFGSWVTAFKMFQGAFSDLESILMVNDSNYGPFSDLSEVIKKLSEKPNVDFWGITDCWDRSYHIQSYFVGFHKTAFLSKNFWKFCEDYNFPKEKSSVISKGEVALTQYLMKGGLECEVLCPYEDVTSEWMMSLEENLAEVNSFPEARANVYDIGRGHRVQVKGYADYASLCLLNIASNIREGKPLNPTHFFWDVLITSFGSPFVKRELVNLNPAGIPNLYKLPLIASDYIKIQSYIKRHKMKIAGCVPPSHKDFNRLLKKEHPYKSLTPIRVGA
jgi:hypothetical protein